MKRIVASVGLVAVGASGLQAELLPAMTTESGKPWSASATLRGFYDDNVNGLSNDQPLPRGVHRGSYGFEASPALQFSFPMEQTSLSFGAVYSYKYYEYRPYLSTEHYDQSVDCNAALTHAFSERYSISVRDSLVIGQEPDMLRAGNTYQTFQRLSGSNLRNYGMIDFMAQLTPEFGLDLGYANTMYSYADNQVTVTAIPPSVSPSISGTSDELQSQVHLDGRYQIKPQTIGIVGIQFTETDYTGNQIIGFDPSTLRFLNSDVRNARSYYGYVGLDHNFRPDLTGSIRAGGRYTDYYNSPSSQNDGAPYTMTSLQYTYLPESYVQLGTSYDYSATSEFSVSRSGSITMNAQSFTVFGQLHHRITPKLYGTIIAQFQNSTFYGGTFDNDTQKYYTVGLNLQYRFTPNFSAEVGYDYDNLDSQVQNLTYDRNRVYIGVTGSY